MLQAASDVYSPVSGKVTEVNEALNDSPDLVTPFPSLSLFPPSLGSVLGLDTEENQSSQEVGKDLRSSLPGG